MSASAKLPVSMTVDEFLNWEEPKDGRKWQLVDGEPRAMSPARLVHNYLQSRLAALIDSHLRAIGRDCDVFVNPGIIPATMSAHNFRIPDLGVSCAPYGVTQVAMDHPVAVVEILSPSNRADTWSNVWAYTSIPSVQEILILRGDAVGGDILRRLPSGNWPDRPAPVVEDLVLESIAFHVPLAELYARTPLMRRGDLGDAVGA